MIESPEDELAKEFPEIPAEPLNVEDFPELKDDDEPIDLTDIEVDDEDLDPPMGNAKVEGDEP